MRVVKPELVIGIAARPYPGESVSGDGWSIDWCNTVCRVALLDGLGHGPQAAAATARAVEQLQAQPQLSPADAMMLCHQTLQGLRGAAISIARIDLARGRLTYAGIGNVEARLLQGGTQSRLIAYRGIVGYAMPTVRSLDLLLQPGWRLLLHTDGVSSRFESPDGAAWTQSTAQAVADAILQEWARATDDATVITVGPRSERSV